MGITSGISIKRKLTSMIMLTSAVTLLVVCGAFLTYELGTYKEHMTEEITTLCDIIGNNATAALSFDHHDDAKGILRSLAAEEHIVMAAIYGKNGEVFATYFRHNPDLRFNPPPFQPEGVEFGKDHLAMFRPIRLEGEEIGMIFIKSDLEEMRARFRQYAIIVGLVLTASLALAFLMSSRLQRGISVPILSLAKTARNVSTKKNYSMRAENPSGARAPIELDMLFTGFNDMLSQIQTRDAELQRNRERLEERVKERTHKLQLEIQERVRTGEQLKTARDEALEASRVKSEFLANMSHEIRTPMNGVIGMTELALGTDLTEEQKEYLEMVRSSADSLLQVINDILDFSKIEAGKFELEARAFSLRDMIGDTLSTVGLRAHEKGLELAWHVDAEVADGLIGDPGRLRQVIINLVSNAIKFTEKGEVVVRAELEAQQSDFTAIHFSVSDTGIGIPSEKLELIFEAFTQVDGSSTRRYGGTGLGLTISSQLVGMMGGNMWIESTTGKGSTFHFRARFGTAKSHELNKEQVDPAQISGMRALVVDDNTTNRRILIDTLVQWKVDAAETESGPDALVRIEDARMAGQPFELMILDVNMPDMDGFELAGRIQERNHLAGVKIIMLTSAGRTGDFARCREMGIQKYLTKPVKQSDLLKALVRSQENKGAEFGDQNAAAYEYEEGTLGADRTKLHILLAEDNLVNQKLAVRILEKAGHTVFVADNGLEAVYAFKRKAFDLILMDIQMPEMGGYEATAVIREQERKKGGRISIIAMTAHAMKGDREACLEAGMDDYLTKPIDGEKLLGAIDRWAPTGSIVGPATVDDIEVSSSVVRTDESTPTATSSAGQEGTVPADGQAGETTGNPATASSEDILDIEALLARLDGDRELLVEIAGLFLESSSELMDEICRAIDKGDPKGLERSAHTLKGSVGNFFAQEAVAAALRLEQIGREGALDSAPEAHEVLKKEIARLIPILENLQKEGVA